MLKQNISQRLQQKLSPQQIQFIKLLQLNTIDFEERVEQELIENPAMEDAKDEGGDGMDISEISMPEAESTSSDSDLDAVDDLDLEHNEFDLSDYTDQDENEGFKMGEDITDDEENKEIPIANSNSFHDQLEEQLSASGLTERELQLADYLIGSLDEDGYLRRPLAAMVNDMSFNMNISTDVEELQKTLKIIQGMDPAGVGARDLQECLLLQLERKNVKQTEVKLAIEIVKNHMEEFSKKHYDKLMRQLKIGNDELKGAIEIIAHLNPKPGESSNDIKTQYIVPDFVVINNNGVLEVSLNSRNAPELRISRNYHETLKGFEKTENPSREQKEAVQFIKQKLDGAKWFIDSVKQRQNTLLSVMRAIVKKQYNYFLDGDEGQLKPMILKDIADEVNLDISTVSRVANSKYVETEFGIISLKSFFSEGITTDEGEEVSNREVKKILLECIEAEDKSKPLSDEKLMDILKERGYIIARRTVAKYREQLNIPVARLRKQL